MKCTDPDCPHLPNKCHLRKAYEIAPPNGFTIVVDKNDSSLCHTMQLEKNTAYSFNPLDEKQFSIVNREELEMSLPSKKYLKQIHTIEVEGETFVDVYRVLDAFPTNSASIDHAIKKLLCAGGRGVKTRPNDLREAIESIEQALQLEHEKELNKLD